MATVSHAATAESKTLRVNKYKGKDVVSRIMYKIKRVRGSGDVDGYCWRWPNSYGGTGAYAHIRVNYIDHNVLRVLFETHRPEIKLTQRHRFKQLCSNNRCVNPDHWSHEQAAYHNAKLSDEQVLDIRQRWAEHLKHKVTMQELGDQYGISRQNVEQIVNNKTRIKREPQLEN